MLTTTLHYSGIRWIVERKVYAEVLPCGYCHRQIRHLIPHIETGGMGFGEYMDTILDHRQMESLTFLFYDKIDNMEIKR